MAVQYTIRENGGFVHTRATGRFTSTEINEAFERLAGDPMLKADHVTLFDTTKAESEAIDDVEFSEVFRLTKHYPDKLVSRKVAILVKDKRFLRNAENYRRLAVEIGEEVRVFASLIEATNWLMKRDL